jgi:nucleotide-binding universal stress UspA family protein
LARHGLQVSAKGLDGIGIGVTEALLSHAADTAADLVVMGSYAHSRLRRLVFGGATSGILSAMTSPVLMAH